MARVTVEDCLTKIPNHNHFELILVAAVRAKDILNGKAPALPRDNSTVSVVVLREIAEDLVNVADIQTRLLTEFDNRNNLNIRHNNVDTEFEEEKVILEEETKDLLIIEDEEGDKLLS